MKYRKYRRMTEKEQREKFGFSDLDLIKNGEWLLPPYNEIFNRESFISEDFDSEGLKIKGRELI